MSKLLIATTLLTFLYVESLDKFRSNAKCGHISSFLHEPAEMMLNYHFNVSTGKHYTNLDGINDGPFPAILASLSDASLLRFQKIIQNNGSVRYEPHFTHFEKLVLDRIQAEFTRREEFLWPDFDEQCEQSCLERDFYRNKIRSDHFTDYDGEFQWSPEKISPQPRPSARNDIEVKFRSFMSKWPSVELSVPRVCAPPPTTAVDLDQLVVVGDEENNNFVTPAKRIKRSVDGVESNVM